MSKQITAEEARAHLAYNPITGEFAWISSAQGRKSAVGTKTNQGYILVTINRKHCRAHRLAWLMVHGEMPPKGMDIDHANGDRADNRLCNLRLATRSQNANNAKLSSRNSTGVKGVFWYAKFNRYQVNFTADKRRVYLGLFKTLEEATAVIKAARESLHGEFCRHA